MANRRLDKRNYVRTQVDFFKSENDEIRLMIKRTGISTRASFIRQAVRLFLAILRYREKGWKIIATKDGQSCELELLY